jgi:putative tryptophan/tyrosine transport system substrate-binding protein
MVIKAVVVLLVGLALISASLAQAQQQTKIAKIGWLSPGTSQSSIRFEQFLRELRKLGYVDGKNVSFESRYFGNEFDRLPALAEELVGLKVEVIVTRGTPETLALKKATKTIPIVFYSVTDPIGAGLAPDASTVLRDSSCCDIYDEVPVTPS